MTLGQIRVEGYKAIVAVSKEDNETLKRNVDVLVQLLQCGERRPLYIVPGCSRVKAQMTLRRSSTSGKD